MEWTVPAEQNGKTVKQVLRGVFSLSENMIKRFETGNRRYFGERPTCNGALCIAYR